MEASKLMLKLDKLLGFIPNKPYLNYATRKRNPSAAGVDSWINSPVDVRNRRGMALITTVLLSAVAVLIVLTMITTTLADLRSGNISTELEASQDLSKIALATYKAELNANPDYYLTQVNEYERARVCNSAYTEATTIVQPGEAWRGECGAVWSYVSSSSYKNVRIEVLPPTPTNGYLTLYAIAKSGGISGGWKQVLEQKSISQWSLVTESDLDLSKINTSNSIVKQLSAYSAGNLTTNNNYKDSILAAENLVIGDGGAGSLSLSGAVNPTELRGVVPSRLLIGALAGSASSSSLLSCVMGTIQNSTENVNYQSGLIYSPGLCLRKGLKIKGVEGAPVLVPEQATRYLLTFAEGGKVNIYYSTASTVSITQETGKSLLESSADHINANTHPGVLPYWTLLTEAYLPVGGIISSDLDVYIGLCGIGFKSEAPCNNLNGINSTGPKGSISVIAGTRNAPKDIWLNGPISDSEGSIAAFAFGRIIVPYWARSANNNLVEAISVGAAGGGIGPNGVLYNSPLQFYPANIDLNLNAVNGSLELRGTAALRNLDLTNFGNFSQTILAPNNRASSRGIPGAPAFDQRWGAISSRNISAQGVCGGTCDAAWYGG